MTDVGARGDRGQTARNAGTDRKRPTPAFKDGPILGVVPIVLGGPSFRVR